MRFIGIEVVPFENVVWGQPKELGDPTSIEQVRSKNIARMFDPRITTMQQSSNVTNFGSNVYGISSTIAPLRFEKIESLRQVLTGGFPYRSYQSVSHMFNDSSLTIPTFCPTFYYWNEASLAEDERWLNYLPYYTGSSNGYIDARYTIDHIVWGTDANQVTVSRASVPRGVNRNSSTISIKLTSGTVRTSVIFNFPAGATHTLSGSARPYTDQEGLTIRQGSPYYVQGTGQVPSRPSGSYYYYTVAGGKIYKVESESVDGLAKIRFDPPKIVQQFMM